MSEAPPRPQSPDGPWWRRALPAAGVLIFVAVLFRAPLLEWEPLYGVDSHRVFARSYEYNAEEILSGRLPMWNPHWLLGVPHLADPQMAVLYPPAVAVFAIFPAGAAVGVYVAIHLIAAGAGAWLLARRLGSSRAGSAVAALVFVCGGAMLPRVYGGQLNYLASAAWMPLVLLLAHRLVAVGNRRLSTAAWLGLALAGQFLAGHPQVVLMTAMAAGVFVIHGMARKCRTDGVRSAAKVAAPAAAGVLLAAALSAIVLVPAWERKGESVLNEGLSYTAATEHSMPLENLSRLVSPGIFGYGDAYRGQGLPWEANPYVGIVALALAIVAVVAGRKDSRTMLLAGVAAGALVLAAGRHLYIYWIAYEAVPGIDCLRAPGRFLLVFQMMMALLAASGLDAAMVVARRRGRELGGRLAAVAIAAAVIEAVVFAAPHVAARPLAEWPDGMARKIGPDKNRHRVVVAGNPSEEGLVLKHRLDSPRGHYGAMSRRITEMTDRSVGAVPASSSGYRPFVKHVSVYDMFGVRALALREDVDYRPLHLQKVEPGAPPYKLWVAPHCMPRAFVVHGAVTIPDEAEALERVVASSDFRMEEVVVLDRDPPRKPEVPEEPEIAPLVISYESERVTLQIFMESAGLLVLSDAYYPGWVATVDGEDAEIFRANHVLRAVWLEPGTHDVIFSYSPASFRRGAVLSLLGVIACAVLLVVERLRRRNT